MLGFPLAVFHENRRSYPEKRPKRRVSERGEGPKFLVSSEKYFCFTEFTNKQIFPSQTPHKAPIEIKTS